MKTIVLFALSLFSFAVSAQTDAGTTSGATIFCDTLNSGFISLTNYNGTILKWQSSTDLIIWKDLNNSTSTQYYYHLYENTSFRALVKTTNANCDTSSVCTISVHVQGESGSISGGGNFCKASNNGSLRLTGYKGDVLDWEYKQEDSELWQSTGKSDKSYFYSSIAASTWFRCILSTYSICPNDTAQPILVRIYKPTEGGNLIGSDTVCVNTNSVVLKLQNSNGDIVSWKLSFDGSNFSKFEYSHQELSILQPSISSYFVVEVKNGVCESALSTVGTVAIHPHIAADAGSDQTITRYQSAQINAAGSGKAQWTPTEGLDQSTNFNCMATPLHSQLYILSTIDEFGCKDSDSLLITVRVPLPTAFTPNNDGVNDSFEIEEIERYPNYKFEVINRWGAVVFSSTSYHNEWQGQNNNQQALPDDVYYYSFSAPDGSVLITNSVLLKR